MQSLVRSASLLIFDMASTFLFLAIYVTTKSIPAAAVAGVALGFAQLGWELARKKPVETMQWMSLFLVVASSIATFLTHDPRFVMFKASAIYVILGVVMLRPGWMNRYLPQVAIEVVPDVAYVFGFIWSALMLTSSVVNIIAAMSLSVIAWTAFMSTWALASKASLFAIQYAVMRYIGQRRRAAFLAEAVPAQA
jgi:intracellular septation protein A